MSYRDPDERPRWIGRYPCYFKCAPFLLNLFWSGEAWCHFGVRVDMSEFAMWWDHHAK